MNNLSITTNVNGVNVDLSKYLVAPYKFSNLLDEQLDEAYITLKFCEIAVFEPLTEIVVKAVNKSAAPVSSAFVNDIISRSDYALTQINDSEWANPLLGLTVNFENKCLTITKTRTFIVANDSSVEVPNGSGRYIHELYLIEETKKTEGYILDNLTFTNPAFAEYSGSEVVRYDYTLTGGLVYNKKQQLTSIFYPSLTTELNTQGLKEISDSANATVGYAELNSLLITNGVVIPKYLEFNEQKPFQELRISKNGATVYWEKYYNSTANGTFTIIHKIDKNGTVTTSSQEAYIDGKAVAVTIEAHDFSGEEWAQDGEFNINYYYYINKSDPGAQAQYLTVTLTNIQTEIGDTKYASSQKKKLTVADVIDRLLDLAEPLTGNEQPRFKLNDEQKQKYNKILAPEFSFSQMTLREALQQVGGFIHAEPRLIGDLIYFDEYGSDKKSNISRHPYVNYKLKSDINEWCTGLDTSAENLVNQLNYAQGVMFEYGRGFDSKALPITVRTDDTIARYDESNAMYIPTSLPIYKLGAIGKVKVTYLPEGNAISGEVDIDITPFVFEKHDYDGLLLSAGGQYPYTKGVALYYEQGSKNIRGLFFKEQNPIDTIFSKYAIINILRVATGDDTFDLSGEDFFKIGFSVTYVPIYSARIKTPKPVLKTGAKRTLVYNQSASLVESQYFGENLKGVVARLGNIEKTFTYVLPFLTDIPQVGYKYDYNYYISAVSVEIDTNIIKATIGLTKDFNRLSEYIGISSNKRMWEISDDYVKRRSVYSEYLVFSKTAITSDENHCFPLSNAFFSQSANATFSAAVIKTKNKDKYVLKSLALPAIAAAVGNTLVFSFEFEDNYNAGQKAVKKTIPSSGGDITGVWGEYVPYCDRFGTFYYIDFSFVKYLSEQEWSGMNVPEYNNVYGAFNITVNNLKYRKDNREAPQISYVLQITTTDDDIIIGSGMASNNCAVNLNPQKMALYGFFKPLNKQNSVLNFDNCEKVCDFDDLTVTANTITLPATTKTYTAWAIAVVPSVEKIKVYDDNGIISEQTLYTGGDLVIGGNDGYSAEMVIYMAIKKDI